MATVSDAEVGGTKPHHQWRILRTSLKQAVDLVKQSEVNEISIVHGLHHARHFSQMGSLRHAVYLSDKRVSI